MNRPANLDIGGLLTIDVESELRKLASAQFQGPWQLPAEIVRRGIRHGADRVDVRLQRHRVEVQAHGAGFDTRRLQWTRLLLDSRQSNETRHAALTALESMGELVLLALAGLEGRLEIHVQSVGPHGRDDLRFSQGRPPSLEHQPIPGTPTSTLIIRSTKLDRKRMRQWLENTTRFSHVPVFLDGTPIARGFEHALAQASLDPPFRGRLVLPIDSELAYVHLLEHGVVTAHLSAPDTLHFEAAVEMGTESTDLSPARVREEIFPHLPQLVDQAARLVVSLGRYAPNYTEAHRSQAARLVLQCVHRRNRLEDAMQAAVFRVFDGQRTRLCGLVDLLNAAQREPNHGFLLLALYPKQDPSQFTTAGQLILVADTVERSRIAELMNVRFRPPDARSNYRSFAATLRRWGNRLRDGWAHLFQVVTHPLRPRVLEHANLYPNEQELLRQLRTHFDADQRSSITHVELCEGRGPIRLTRGSQRTLTLPRANPVVLAAIRAINTDPTWVYPAAVALLEGKASPPASSRARWLSRERTAR